MFSAMQVVLLGAIVLPSALAFIAEHEVTSLPGFDGALPSKHFSGYLPVGNRSGAMGMLHYWLILAENDPENAPVTYWTNGGPGSSGISNGLLTQMGQVALNEKSFDEATADSLKLFYNDLSWSKNANMLFISQPKGVGFSYCEELPCVNSDETAALDAYEFSVEFFQAYPEYNTNDFYISGESYAGNYIPMMLDQMRKENFVGIENFAGALIGNGCWGNAVGLCAFGTPKAEQIEFEYYRGHSMVEQTIVAAIDAACGDFTTLTADCRARLREMSTGLGSFNIYNSYDTCGKTVVPFEETSSYVAMRMDTSVVSTTRMEDSVYAHPQLIPQDQQASKGALNDFECGGGEAAAAWLQQPNVEVALHVGHPNMGRQSYSKDRDLDLRPLYKDLASSFRLLIYSGDTDACVPAWGSEEWVRELGFPVKTPWRQWLSQRGGREDRDEVRAGYVIEYDTQTAEGELTFMTVQGAGHMVQTSKPLFSRTMFETFMAGGQH